MSEHADLLLQGPHTAVPLEHEPVFWLGHKRLVDFRILKPVGSLFSSTRSTNLAEMGKATLSGSQAPGCLSRQNLARRIYELM